MKPITDEFILSIIERADSRQLKASPAGTSSAVAGPNLPKRKSLRGPAGIISLEFARSKSIAQQTVSGLFCYSPHN